MKDRESEGIGAPGWGQFDIRHPNKQDIMMTELYKHLAPNLSLSLHVEMRNLKDCQLRKITEAKI